MVCSDHPASVFFHIIAVYTKGNLSLTPSWAPGSVLGAVWGVGTQGGPSRSLNNNSKGGSPLWQPRQGPQAVKLRHQTMLLFQKSRTFIDESTSLLDYFGVRVTH